MKQTQALDSVAYEMIKQKIMDGTYKMRQPLREETLAEELQISRTPIRQALRQLEGEDFVEIISFRGCFVRELTTDDIREIYLIRSALESACARAVTPIISAANIDLLTMSQQEAEQLASLANYEESREIGRRLHTVCIEVGGGRRVQKILKNLSEQIDRLDYLSAQVPGRLERSNQEHATILQAIIGRDADKVESLMRQHIMSTCEDVIMAVRNEISPLYYTSP
ncbi:GntR family transcriptional regulator [Ruminococcaceae bacterium OttesenSCG-928-A16]|nr:GntR family transcriptional regulator [Ruminococcaceae bacterium OttesenSCG-928-A16]